VLVGSSQEAAVEKIYRENGGSAARSLVGATGLLETFAVLERCSLLIANDTGLAKAAAAFGTPTATLWGPSDPAEFRSPWDPERHLDVRTSISCSPCSWMGTPARPYNYINCGGHDCLARLEVETVAAALLRRWPRLEKKAARA
jgi:heptosyltransferase-2